MSLKHTLTASAVMILTWVFLKSFSLTTISVVPNKPFSTFPTTIGKWVGKEEHFSKQIYDVLKVDDSFYANYASPEGHLINLYIGFYRSQGIKGSIHSPKNCMPGAGWNIVDQSLQEITIPGSNPDKIKVLKLLLKKDSQKQVSLYWYQSRGRVISSEYMQKIYRVIDAATKHRTDGSFVRLIAPVFNDDEAASLNLLKDFTKQLFPILNEYIPS